MNRKAFTFIQAVIILVILAVLAVLLFPAFFRTREGHGNRNACQSNLKQIGLGMRQYTQDYDDKYPLVSAGKAGWMESVYPYVKSEQIFQCPKEASGNQPKTTDYFYNARLVGTTRTKLDVASSTIMNGDGAGDAAQSSSLRALPPAWRSDSNSPAQRHDDGMANYSFADGHVKMLSPDAVTSEKPSAGVATFAIK